MRFAKLQYLSAFPGRKNLIWFSGSFPLTIMPDESVQNPFATIYTNEDGYRETADLLTHSQVAVYPVDARGLIVNPAFSAANSGQELNDPRAVMASIIKFTNSQANEHDTMDKLANDTGGHAFYNTNGLTRAVAEALNQGSNYYSLFYNPSNSHWDGQYRAIHVELSGAAATRGYQLSYRRGYFAFEPGARSGRDDGAPATTERKRLLPRQPVLSSALQRGAPTPSQLLFKVGVLPQSETSADNLTSDDQPNPNGKFKAPYRRYQIDCASLPQGFTWEKSADGHYQAAVMLQVMVYDSDGLLLNAASKGTRLNVDAPMLKSLLTQGLQTHIDVSAPLKGDNYLRIALRDLHSDKLGVLEFPIAAVSRLAPRVASSGESTKASTSPTAAPLQ